MKPMRKIAASTIPVKSASSGHFMTRRSMMSEGMESATRLIMNAIVVPSATPFVKSAEASGTTAAGRD